MNYGSYHELAAVLERGIRPALPFVLAVDGRCGSGKTTLANYIAGQYRGSLIHMDDFFLRPEQRTAERLVQPGGNIDYERFESEVLPHLRDETEEFSYSRYDCSLQRLTEQIRVSKKELIIVEGAYSCHPRFGNVYDFKIFLDIDEKEQHQRILKRNGKEMLVRFMDEWIPKEELYFRTFSIKEKCNLVLDGGKSDWERNCKK